MPPTIRRTSMRNISRKLTQQFNKIVFCCLLSSMIILLFTPAFADDKAKDEETIRNANLVLQDMLNDNSISPALLSKADCVLLLMNQKVVNQVINGKTKMGTDATAAAGPGATAAAASDADILTYGKTKGVFAGVSLGGATTEPDNDANQRLYGKTLTATDIVRGTSVRPSGEGESLVTVLNQKLTKHSN